MISTFGYLSIIAELLVKNADVLLTATVAAQHSVYYRLSAVQRQWQ